MLSVKDAIEKIIAKLNPVGFEEIAVGSTQNRILFEDFFSPIDYPLFSNSSMDGFAVRAKDVLEARPEKAVYLEIAGSSIAGETKQAMLKPNQAALIMTGAAVPIHADAVVPVEHTDANFKQQAGLANTAVGIFKPVSAGEFIRRKGEDFKIGEKLIRKGSLLRPQEVSLLAMCGATTVKVFRKLKIAYFSTGNELVSVDHKLEFGKIRETNSYLLETLAQRHPVEFRNFDVALDNKDDIRSKLKKILEFQPDLIISSAGVSMGTHDYVKEVVEEKGKINFWKVNVRPGKPLAYGEYNSIPYVGLPGNPVSCFVTFKIFVEPAIRYMIGQQKIIEHQWQGKLQGPIESDGRESYLRGIYEITDDQSYLTVNENQSSGNLLSLSRANCLIIIPEKVKYLEKGSVVRYIII